ncbi:MAG: SDR family NAD(P)-dependent oxidoreductase [Clostridiales bacterium]|nr:SDR family NAD(P)-dependent oxidoreductase [Clostridiales bacterium]
MKNALVVGGNSGIGLSLVIELIKNDYNHIYIVGKDKPIIEDIPIDLREQFTTKTEFYKVNLINEEYEIFDKIQDINTLIITAGFGRIALFEDLNETEITNLIKCNELSIIRIIKKYYQKILNEEFYTAIIGSIAGHVASPLFSVYGASKMGLCGFIENINIELMKKNTENRILDVSPGSLKGTKFEGGKNDINQTQLIAENIIENMFKRNTLYIPQYDEVYKNVIERYQNNPIKFGIESYDYKMNNRKMSNKTQVVIGYLSGTFDLFHIGHLNLLRRAKEQCDYLIVGVHKSGAWKRKETFIPFEERKDIVGHIKYVDKVIESYPEDADAWNEFHYNKLFVGSDYKGTERFNRYEEYFKDKDVEIVYFPYTQGTSSTQLRDALKK